MMAIKFSPIDYLNLPSISFLMAVTTVEPPLAVITSGKALPVAVD